MNIVKRMWLVAVILLVVPQFGFSSIDIGGLIFDDQAFADRIMSTDYTGLLTGCPGSEVLDLESALLGHDLNTWIDYGVHDYFPGEDGDYNSDAPPTQYIEVSFVDNLVVNGAGDDIAIFQMGAPNAVRVSLDLDSILNPGAGTSSDLVVVTPSLEITNDCGIAVNVGYVDLSDFGLAANDEIYHLFLSSPLGVYGEVCGPPTGYNPLQGGVPELAAVGALNSGVKTNDAPLVDDLDDAVASLPAADLAVKAVARDDGLPQPSAITCLWAMDSGPGTVTFDDANLFETTAHFSAEGSYVLSAEVSDGVLTTTRTMSVTVTGTDTEPPSAPGGLAADVQSGSRINLTWDASSDNAAVAEYKIYRDGLLAGSTADLAFTDTGLQLLTTYTYHLVAVDISGNPSAAGGSVPATTRGYITELLIGSADDDAEEVADGTMELGSKDLDLVNNGAAGDQVVGLRFSSVAAPQNAQVISAWIEFTTDAADLDPTSLVIGAEASGNAPQFTASPYDLSTRAAASASVAWDNVEAWPAEHYFHQSPDISPVVQELLERSDWVEDNAMVFLIRGSGLRRAKSYESGELVSAMLHVEYSLPLPVNQAPVVDAGADLMVSLPAAFIQLSGNVRDDGLPDGNLDLLWSFVSGPNLMTFSDPTQANPHATFFTAGHYVLQLTADDGEYQVSDTMAVDVFMPDTEPPSIPQNLAALAVSGSRVDLSWDPSTDNEVVSHYVVYRDGAIVGTATGTSFIDTGLLPVTVYQYAVQACDLSGNCSLPGDTVFTVTLQESTLISVQVADGDDDAEEGEDGSIQLNSTDLEMVEDVGSGTQVVGLRFDGIALPPGALVTSAWLEFETDEVKSAPASLLITAQDSGDAAAFSDTDFDITSRTTLGSSVAWDNLPPWDVVDERHDSPDLTLLVQSLVDRGDWLSGNAMAFIITGSGVRTAESFEGEQAGAPILHVEYSPGVPVNSAPWVDAGPDVVVEFSQLPLQLAGTVYDDGLPYETLTVSWSRESGPGTADFNDPALADTEVGFDAIGLYVLQLSADDGEYSSDDTVTVLVTDQDYTPPSIPQNLHARLETATRVNLTWDASTDDVAVAGYFIYRDGFFLWRTTGTAYTDSSVSPNTAYEYTVQAFDNSDNFSGLSDPVSIFTGLHWRTGSVREIGSRAH